MIYTDEIIMNLITCEKEMIEGVKKATTNRDGFTKHTFDCRSTDGMHSFYCFITQNTFFVENFSIGLSHNPSDQKGKIVLLRVNGIHGGTELFPHHAEPHLHFASAERINAGLKAEGRIEPTTEYITIDEAKQFFVRYINIIPRDRKKYFPEPDNQIPLFL